MSDHNWLAQVAHQKWVTMSELLRLLTKDEQMSELLVLLSKPLIRSFFRKKLVIRSENRWVFPALNFSNFVFKYLGEIETEFKNTLACLSGSQIIHIMKKMEVKNLVTHLLQIMKRLWRLQVD